MNVPAGLNSVFMFTLGSCPLLLPANQERAASPSLSQLKAANHRHSCRSDGIRIATEVQYRKYLHPISTLKQVLKMLHFRFTVRLLITHFLFYWWCVLLVNHHWELQQLFLMKWSFLFFVFFNMFFKLIFQSFKSLSSSENFDHKKKKQQTSQLAL